MAVDESIANVARREVTNGGLSETLMGRTLPAASISLPARNETHQFR
jgi:hypothetical protein